MSRSEPFFSIVIPTYNRAQFIRECIDSVLSQDFSDYEIIVVDDGSTDNTEKILSSYLPKIRYLKQSNRGAEEARNRGILSSKGRYIVFLDSDDILLPFALRVYYMVIQKDSPPLLISTPKFFKDKFNLASIPLVKKIEYLKYKDYLSKKHSVWLGNSVLIIEKNTAINKNIFFSQGSFPVDDLDFILMAGILSPFVYIINPPTVGYRVHSSNSIHNVKVNLRKLSLILSKEKKGEYPGGKKRKIERLAIIGGHAQLWIRQGVAAKYYKESLILFVKSFFALVSVVIRKLSMIFSRAQNEKNLIKLDMFTL